MAPLHSLAVIYVLGDPLLSLIIWGGVALLVLLLFMRQPARIALSDEASGSLHISRHALHRLLEACCEQLNGVARARAKVNRKGGKLHTSIRLKVRPNAKLDAIQGYLKEELALIYTRNLGLSEVGPINIDVIGVMSEVGGFETSK